MISFSPKLIEGFEIRLKRGVDSICCGHLSSIVTPSRDTVEEYIPWEEE